MGLGRVTNLARIALSTLVGLAGPALSETATRPPLQVSFASPEGQLVELPGAITLVFSQPMQALAGTVAATAPVGSVRRLSDHEQAAGHWVWYGAQTAVFYWSRPPHHASDYEVTIAADLRALDGTTLGLPWAFGFSTPVAALRSVELDASNSASGYQVDCRFNQAVHPSEVERAVRII